MESTASPAPAASDAPVSRHPVPPGQLAWLEGELRSWVGAGLLEPAVAESIRARYVEVRRFSLVRLLLGLGACFVGVGLIWLVATNLDRLSPLLRFLLLTTVWLGLTGAAEALAGWRAHRGGEASSPVLGAARLLAALSFGAVVFQAAQSLQVPAHEPRLVGIWGAGVLVYAYAVGGLMPLLVGLGLGAGWFVWQAAESANSALGFVAAVLVGGVLASAVALLHASRWLRATGVRRAFEVAWREVGALLVLIGLFAAALPFLDSHGFAWSASLVAGLVVALLATGAALAGAPDRRSRLELLAPVAALVVGVLLVLWGTRIEDLSDISGAAYVEAGVSVLVYLLAAGWYAVLGVLRDSPRLTVLATIGLVVFTTFQAFAVFAPIVSGAALFLLVGVVLVVTGFVADRGRRQLVSTVEAGVA